MNHDLNPPVASQDSLPGADQQERRIRRRFFAGGFAAGVGATLLLCLVVSVLLPLSLLMWAGVFSINDGWPSDGLGSEMRAYEHVDVTDSLKVDDSGSGTVSGWPTGESGWSSGDETGDRFTGGYFVIVIGKAADTVNEVSVDVSPTTRFLRKGKPWSFQKFTDRGGDDMVRVTFVKTDIGIVAQEVDVIGGSPAPYWVWE